MNRRLSRWIYFQDGDWIFVVVYLFILEIRRIQCSSERKLIFDTVRHSRNKVYVVMLSICYSACVSYRSNSKQTGSTDVGYIVIFDSNSFFNRLWLTVRITAFGC